MGSAQREATFVAIGLVIVATLVLVYMFNEPNRREVAAEEKVQESIARGTSLYIQYCVSCHGPEGLAGEGRQGVPLNTPQNQTTDPALGPEREQIIRRTIIRGRGAIMPAWGQSDGGPLNDQQVEDLVTLIRKGDWKKVHEEAVKVAGGEPTPPPTPTLASTEDQGQALFGQVCANCHKSNDYPNGGSVGPDLTNLAANPTTPMVGIEVNAEALAAWINDPKSVKPDAIMPAKGGATSWTDTEVNLVVEYLLSLK